MKTKITLIKTLIASIALAGGFVLSGCENYSDSTYRGSPDEMYRGLPSNTDPYGGPDVDVYQDPIDDNWYQYQEVGTSR